MRRKELINKSKRERGGERGFVVCRDGRSWVKSEKEYEDTEKERNRGTKEDVVI